MTFEEILPEFYEENKNNLGQFMPKFHKRGPYSKQDKDARRNEIYRLHFEYGYSARKIAELMNINRNTINGDIKHWYSKVAKKSNEVIQPESAIFTTLERLDIQRTRIREYLDKSSNISERIAIEKVILDIDCKIAHVHQKLADSSSEKTNYAVDFLNEYLKSGNKKERIITLGQKLSVSDSALAQINKIIAEDKKKNLWSKQN